MFTAMGLVLGAAACAAAPTPDGPAPETVAPAVVLDAPADGEAGRDAELEPEPEPERVREREPIPTAPAAPAPDPLDGPVDLTGVDLSEDRAPRTFTPNARSPRTTGVAATGRPRATGKSRPARARRHRVNCAFPPEAAEHDIDRASVTLSVSLDAAGKLVRVRILSDPGYGFGQAALDCAKTMAFDPALDDDGTPVASRPAVRIRFKR